MTVGVGLTVILTVDVAATQGDIPVVVRVKTATPENTAGGAQVAVNVFAFGVKVPPAGVLHVPPVADPPTLPAKTTEPPWHIVWGGPAFEVGVVFTVIVTIEVTAVQVPVPVAVNVRIAEPVNAPGGVQVAVKVLASGVNVPPAGVLHVPPVAVPPTLPARTAEPPWQIV